MSATTLPKPEPFDWVAQTGAMPDEPIRIPQRLRGHLARVLGVPEGRVQTHVEQWIPVHQRDVRAVTVERVPGLYLAEPGARFVLHCALNEEHGWDARWLHRLSDDQRVALHVATWDRNTRDRAQQTALRRALSARGPAPLRRWPRY